MVEYTDFADWVSQNDLLYKNFIVLKAAVKEYLYRRIQDGDNDFSESIYSNFSTVIARCDEISYDEPGIPEAYIILHFLDRYHRFQLIFMDMIKDGYFPIKGNLAMMDIGTGPGPSLYAYSDMIMLLRKYEEEKFGTLSIKEVNIDYVEQSNGFRDFLHHVTESLMMTHECFVPFHHGTYYSAEELDFKGRIKYYIDFPWYHSFRWKFVKRSFDMIIYSNFLTNLETIYKFKGQIKSAAFYLKNRGVLVVVGGNPKDKKYSPVYEELNKIVLKHQYNTRKYGGTVEN